MLQAYQMNLGMGQGRFYNKKQTPTQIESLLVRPLSHSIKIFRANAQSRIARSYAGVVKGVAKNHTK